MHWIQVNANDSWTELIQTGVPPTMAFEEVGKKTDMGGGVIHCRPDACEYSEASIYGTSLARSPIFQGDHGVRSAFFKMKKGDVIANHKHKKWVQVAILSGCVKVNQDVTTEFVAEAGSVYFLDPGYFHIETAVEDSTLLVTQGEDRPGWLKDE